MSIGPNKLTLLKIPGHVLEESPTAHKSIAFLTQILNTGYDFNKYKYGVIQSTRVKDESVFLNDLGIHVSGSFLLVLIKDKDYLKDNLIHDLNNHNYTTTEADNQLSFEQKDYSQVLGTIGIKPAKLDADVGKGWEITGFTSFQKGVGQFLMRKIEECARLEGLDYLFASCICEHNLVAYYEKLGYTEIGERILIEIDENGLVKGSVLEDHIYATRNFTLATLKKDLNTTK